MPQAWRGLSGRHQRRVNGRLLIRWGVPSPQAVVTSPTPSLAARLGPLTLMEADSTHRARNDCRERPAGLSRYERVSSEFPLFQPRVSWWAGTSAVVAPAALLGAWVTPSPAWWLTPTAVTVAGAAYVLVAAGLRPADPASRCLLAAGGALTVLSGWLPMVGRVGLWHTAITDIGWVTLCVWPALIAPDRRPLSRVLRRSFGECLAVALGALLLLCVVTRDTVIGAGESYGLPQHLLMTAQAAVPLVIVLGLTLTATQRQAARRAKDAPRVPSAAGAHARRQESRVSLPAESEASRPPEAGVRRPAEARR